MNLLYLVNEIVQNSRARRKDDFPNSFSPIMPEAAQTAYRSATTEIQQKIRRLVEIWRARNVFEGPIQDAIEARLDEIDKTRPTGKKPLMGGSLFGSSSSGGGLPKELESLSPLQLAVSKANLSTPSTTNTANVEYDKLQDPSAQPPAPPLHAARLSALVKSLATAESSVAESVRARKALISELEKILQTNRASLNKDEATLAELQSRKMATETKRRDVEENIRRTANAEPDGTYNHGERAEGFNALESVMDRPEYEALTPPPVEALTPPPAEALTPTGSPGMDFQGELRAEPQSLPQPTSTGADRNPDVQSLLASMSSAGAAHAPPLARPSTHAVVGMGMGMNGFGGSSNAAKKRKMTHQAGGGGAGGELPAGFGVEVDLDEDVAEMIRQESRGVGGGGGGG